jgi:ABC-type glutathione transport system ATPase component
MCNLLFNKVRFWIHPIADKNQIVPLYVIFLMTGGVILFLGGSFFSVLEIKKRLERNGYIAVNTDDNETEAQRRQDMMSNHIPCTIMFRNINYMIESDQKPDSTVVQREGSVDSVDENVDNFLNNGRLHQVVLEGIQGSVRPGEVMAIMGGSGAGKTTLLDILARKNKAGVVTGDILVNGEYMDYEKYRSIIG